jgi:methionyl aminopeptidase
MPIELKSRDEIRIMQEAGRVTAEVLQMLVEAVRPGESVAELDRIVRREYKRRGCIATFLNYQPDPAVIPYPGTVCVSINDQIVHGIPRDRELRDGDIVSLDLGATVRGYVGDTAVSVACGEVSAEAQQLMDATREALRLAILASQPGARMGDVGHAIQGHAAIFGYGVVREYVGHGVGRTMHEAPNVPNYGEPGKGIILRPGMVYAIEPMFNLGTHQTRKDPDGWTVWTADNSLSAHFEHTIAITPDGPLVLTLPAGVSQEDYLGGRALLDRPRVATPATAKTGSA